MAQSFRQSMAWLHTWAGLIPAWIVCVIFLFGTSAYFEREISAWMRPEVHSAPVSAKALDAAGRVLAARGVGAESWTVTIPGKRGGDALLASWLMPGQSWRDRHEVRFDPATGRELQVRDTEGGYFLYRFHFDLHAMPVSWARMIVSMAALAMLVAIISGIVTHKKIFADFFMLRFNKGP
ncbi:PepSY-associated transmembrane protein [Novosphingobium sp. PhB57]|nr:PepSY-associated transmembrane protein [Novosphingobium sp. PhB57]